MTLIMACVCNASNLNHNFFHALYIKCQCFLNCKGCGRNTVNDTLGCVRKKIFMSYPNTCLEWWQKPWKTAVTPASPWAKNWKRYLVNTTIMHNAYLGVGISRTIVSGSTGPSYFPFFCFFCSFFNLMFRNCSYGQYQYVKMATVRIIIQFYK